MTDALYREICRNPEDDTLRLAYADWLDENGDPDRAEFVRVQFGLHPLNDLAEAIHPAALLGSSGMRRESLLASNHRLLDAHPEWSRCPCEVCQGRTWGAVSLGEFFELGTCPTCSGTGDLFRHRVFDPGLGPNAVRETARTVTFTRGFPDSVSCTLAEAFTPDGTPTPWACEVVRRTPVTRFVLYGFVPTLDEDGWEWYGLPEWLYEPGVKDTFPQISAAVDALALAAGRLVRRHVYGEVTA